MSGDAFEVDKIELEKGLLRWSQISFWLDDQYTTANENELPGTWRLGTPPDSPSSDWAVLVRAASGAVLHSLAVTSGSGSGDYPAGARVPIVADPPPSGQSFATWTGDTQHLDSAGSSSTTGQ